MSEDLGGVGVENTITWRNDFSGLTKRLERSANGAVSKTLDEGVKLARQFAPDKTGELRRSIHKVYDGNGEGAVVASAPHWAPQESGAKEHTISPTNAKGILANKEEDFFARGPVRHPGNPATHFLRDAYTIMQGLLMAMLEERLNR